MNKRTQKDQTLSSNASATSNLTVLAPVFVRVMCVNSLLTHYSEASVSILVECFSP
ncbi:hypothetical protein D8674_039970 [Pyrus ussuriensis x Pyrus communis]|uniref:Uncharacterized protein n=1 Tax=Pyrus ussuriensis x Pyrus communis TaxID=2448454 RepID=A0A5N5G2I9_9ROSA|nr:hypothetical protein D8674_039970 [Pyrus ussuriensis x Pyrus communis]